jgi:hypothetical protein
MKWRSAAVLPVVASLLWGCSSKSTSPAGSDGGAAALDDGGAALDDGVVDASTMPTPADASTADTGTDGGGDATLAGCGVKRAASAGACADACDARLALPGGGSFCTIQCGHDSDCGGPGADLICPGTVGACVPRCAADASCKAAGFLRCDADTDGCDTL